MVNRSVLDIRNMRHRTVKVAELLKRKAHGYEARGWDAVKATSQQLETIAKSKKVAISQRKGSSCGWSEISTARFCADNYPCLSTVTYCPEPVFPKLNPISDLKTDRHTVGNASAPGPWNFYHQHDRGKFTRNLTCGSVPIHKTALIRAAVRKQ